MKKVKLFTVVLLGCLPLFTSCKKEKTSWDSDYKLIIINDTLMLENLSKDSLFAQDAITGDVRLSFEKEVLDFDISDQVSIPDTTIIQKYGIAVNTYTVQPGFSFVNNVTDHVFDLRGAKLTLAGIKTGEITLEVENPYETNATFDVSLPKVKKGGVVLMRTLNVAKGTQSNPTKAFVNVDISNYDIDLTGTDGTGFNSLQTVLKVTSDPNGPTIQITKYDTTTFKATFKNLRVDHAKGYFGNQSISQSFNEKVPFFDKLSGIVAIEDYNLSLILENSCKLEGMLKILDINNKNTITGNSVALQNPIIGNPIFVQTATGNWQNHQPSIRMFNFNPLNSNLSDFIANLGSLMSGNIQLKLNPNGNTYSGWNELFSDSRIKVKLKADMPLKIKLEDLVFKDTFDIQLKNQLDKTRLTKGKLIMEATNAYPIDMIASLELLDENDHVIGVVNSSDRIKSSTEGSFYFNGLSCAKSTVKFELNEDLAGNLQNVKKLVVRFKANSYASNMGTIPSVTTIPYNGFIATKVYGDFGVKFKL